MTEIKDGKNCTTCAHSGVCERTPPSGVCEDYLFITQGAHTNISFAPGLREAAEEMCSAALLHIQSAGISPGTEARLRDAIKVVKAALAQKGER